MPRWVGIAEVWSWDAEDQNFVDFIPVLVTGSFYEVNRKGGRAERKALAESIGAEPEFMRWEFLRSEPQYRKDMQDRERLLSGRRKPGPNEQPVTPGGAPRWKYEEYYKQYGPTMVSMLKEDDARRERRKQGIPEPGTKPKPYQYESRAEEDEAAMERARQRQDREYDKWIAEQERKKQEEDLPDVPAHWYWEE